MTQSDPLFEQTYNQKILDNLETRFGPVAQHHTELQVTGGKMLTMMQKMRQKNSRRGEVVMLVPNSDGEMWLHAKQFYPAGTYRLMTGGLVIGETPTAAMVREVAEETGFEVAIEQCLAVITYHLYGNDDHLPFASYLFVTPPQPGYPQPTDPNEKISDFKAVSPTALAEVAQQLRQLPDEYAEWQEWGKFRAVAHDVAARQLAGNGN